MIVLLAPVWCVAPVLSRRATPIPANTAATSAAMTSRRLMR